MIAEMDVFDMDHEMHRMTSLPSRSSFILQGPIEFGHASYSLLQVVLLQQFPVPIVTLTDQSKVLHHDCTSWDNLFETVDMCCYFGGMSHGSHAMGLQTRVAVDRHAKMCELFSKQFPDVPVVHGDLAD